jgi:hypothetical protein
MSRFRAITIANTSGQTIMQYWDGTKWELANNMTVSGNTTTGNIPVAALTGTPIAVGSVVASPIDFYHDGNVNFRDIVYFVEAYIQYNQYGTFNPACDLNHNGKIDFSDIQLSVQDYITYNYNN